MPATALDSVIFRDIFTTPAMREVFSDEFRTRCYLDIEAALARVQGRLGIIPQDAADEIAAQCRIENIDFARLKTQTERIGYPILGVVQQIVGFCRDGLGEWCHWGATTQDITDTATIMQVRAALDLVESDMEAVAAALTKLAREHRDTAMAGRSNLQQAVPLTFGFKCAALLAAMQRHRARLKELRPRVLVGEFGGAVGTLASLGKDGLKVQFALMDELGLGQPDIAWHTVRDRIGEVACFLGLVTSTLGKISMDVKLLMQTEVGEVFEPFHQGRGSSSTMPQKRNPVASLYIHATAALVRQNVAALLEAAVADHERSTGPWEIEWIALPEIFLLSSGALAQTRDMVAGLQVDAKRMRANLDITNGTIVSETVMMGLGPYLGRQRAHDL
ncbi:MAG: 3-carboxy-cis,cis-muconate cycloisomerase, partial [Rhizobiales bacterium]|nr:3-carboxy-cis,cis-muconate cycloisomerase [Hyphomicrobiales bacterium]